MPETLLLVEDEPTIRQLMASALTDAGYRVLEARHGREALDVFERYGETIDLLLTDIRLPKLDGHFLIDRLRSISRTLKVVAISGYTPEAPAGAAAFIRKPFSRAELLRTVRAVLDGSQ